MEDVMVACCVLHNMIVEVRKDGYTGTQNASVTVWRECLGQVSGVNLIAEPEDLREASLFWMARLSEEDSPLLHRELKQALESAMREAKGGETN
jgi:hypothetical protein